MKNYDYSAFQSDFEDTLRVAKLETALGLQPPIVEYTGKVEAACTTPTARGVHVPHKCTPECVQAWQLWEAYRDSLRGRAAQALVAAYALILRVWRAL